MTAPERIWATTNGIQPLGGSAGLWRSDTPHDATEYIRADLAAVPAQVRVKPLDLSNALKHAFIAGRVSAGAASSFHADAWVEYDPTESAGYTRILAAIEPQPDPRDEHFDDYAVRSFAKMMAAKMAASRAKGRGGWSDPKQCSVEYLRRLLYTHLDKGDPVDVANICMMLRHYEASTAHEYESSAMAAACASRDEVLARLVDALRLYGCDCEQCAEGVIAALAAAKAVQHG